MMKRASSTHAHTQIKKPWKGAEEILTEYGMLNPQRGLLSFEHSISPLLGFCEKTNCLHIKKNSKVKREHHSEVGAVVTEVLMHS